ncbi:hypothetical protein BFU36_07325 [Sulfolobus sp. A20]|uniref:hypothetical protein n=1 Tax=Saccharolobus sp. A20 TaxID=1891280 RepID=UPI0008462111|nr:hypothetical protein [Sulfolobus sp. A20]AOL16539.1 hypothetical protein BFU36_07325 [Sulfolobus sp. A20]TRM74756.1 hypothetical protein DJ528_10065 [Sulfolobus sp. B5]
MISQIISTLLSLGFTPWITFAFYLLLARLKDFTTSRYLALRKLANVNYELKIDIKDGDHLLVDKVLRVNGEMGC